MVHVHHEGKDDTDDREYQGHETWDLGKNVKAVHRRGETEKMEQTR